MSKPVFISIGATCCVKYQLDQQFSRGKPQANHQSQPTLFFDWLLSSMDAVCCILEHYDAIDEILNLSNIKIAPLTQSM